MKKLKQLIVFCLVAVMALAFSACGEESKELTSISVDSSAAKTEYTVGEEFSSDGIVVTANYSDSSTETVSSGNYTVDSSAYSSTTAGTYSIVVSYSGMSASYSVTVSEAAVVTTVKLSSISLNTDAATTLFYVGQDFDSTGLVVTANFDDNSTATVSLTDSDLTIDRSAYVKSEVGTYRINVYYTYGSTTKSANYSVEVTDVVPMAGLDIYADDEIVREITYTLSSENPSVLLSADDLTVYLHEILDSGTNDYALTSSEYTVKYFDSNQNELTTEAQRTVSSAGIYQIWVYSSYTESAYGVTYEISSFVKVEVVNGVVSLALDNTNTSAVYTQVAGADKISSTWTYTATYANGDVKTLTADDVTVTLDTKTVSASSVATVSYVENDVTVTCEVPYSITEEQKKEGITSYTMTYAATDSSFAITWGENEDTNGTVTITDSGITTWKDKIKSTEDGTVTYQYAVETKAYSSKAFKINIAEGATNVTITVYFSHTSSAARPLYLGTVADSLTDGVIDTLTIGSADGSPSTLSVISGTGLSAGDYYVYSDGSTIHVYAIVVSYDTGTAATTSEYAMTYAATDSSFAITWGENEDTNGTVTITDSGITTWKDKIKSTEDGTVTYQYAVETKAYSSKAFKINIAEGATNVTITVYFSHTSSAARPLYLGTVADSLTDGVIDTLTIGSADGSPSTLSVISGTGLSAGDYYVYSDGSTIHVYAIVVTYEI